MSKRIADRLTLVITLLLALAIGGFAQNPPPRGKPGPPGFGSPGERDPRMGPGPGQGPPPGSGFNLLSAEFFPDNKLVKGVPYSATATTESVQVLGDGTRITRKRTATIHRDSEGRTRIEHKLDSIGPFPVAGEPPHLIFINDVVAGTRYVLEVNNRTARKLMPPPNGAPPFAPPAPPQARIEALGKQTIEGIEAVGTRATVTIPAGQIGNDRPISIVSERWESPELQIVVLNKHNDPRIGETVYSLTGINRGEPARSLFEVPADFKVVEAPPPGPPMRRMKRPENE